MNTADFQAFMRGLDLIKPPPAPRFYAESDGDRHAMTYYVCHTRLLFFREDCHSMREARTLALQLNERFGYNIGQKS